MFMGHYGVALALKKTEPVIPLWIYFLMTTLADIILYILMIAGVEVLEKSPGYTEWVPLKAVYYAYSHGLISNLSIACFIFIIAVIIIRIKKPGIKACVKIPLILAAAFLSHFLCDIVVHAQDMVISPDGTVKAGLGLWNYPVLSNLLELSVFIGGISFYRKQVFLNSSAAKKYFIIFMSAIILLHFMSGFIEPMDNMKITAINLLILSFAVILSSWLFEKKFVYPAS